MLHTKEELNEFFDEIVKTMEAMHKTQSQLVTVVGLLSQRIQAIERGKVNDQN